MIKRTLPGAAIVAFAVAAFAGATPPEADPGFHFALVRSAPMADSTVAQVHEVRLWFTEAPESGTVSIRVVDADEEALETGEVTQDPDDARVYFVALESGLTAGDYTVAWRGMGADGHAVRETFTFSVAGG